MHNHITNIFIYINITLYYLNLLLLTVIYLCSIVRTTMAEFAGVGVRVCGYEVFFYVFVGLGEGSCCGSLLFFVEFGLLLLISMIIIYLILFIVIFDELFLREQR